jgi:NitT/TauT family transport system substrate-binding protein
MRFVCILALLALTVTANAAAQQAAGTELRYGNLGPNATEAPLYIAEQQGYLRDEGIRLSTTSFTATSDLVTAVATGAVDVSGTQTDTGIAAIANGADIRIVGSYFRTVPFRLITTPAITSWQQLRGAAVSLGSKTGSSVIAYRRLLRAHGVSDADIAIAVAGTTTARLGALKSGAVQATMLLQPGDFVAQGQGLKIMAESDEVMHKDWVWATWIVNNKWAKANPASVTHLVRALRKAIAYGYAHPEQTIALLETNNKIDHETAEKTYDLLFRKWQGFERDLHVDPNALKNVASYLVTEGSITRVPATAELYDPSYLQAARR